MDRGCPFSCPPLMSAEDDRRKKWSLKDRRSGPGVPGAEDAHRSYEQKHKRELVFDRASSGRPAGDEPEPRDRRCSPLGWQCGVS